MDNNPANQNSSQQPSSDSPKDVINQPNNNVPSQQPADVENIAKSTIDEQPPSTQQNIVSPPPSSIGAPPTDNFDRANNATTIGGSIGPNIVSQKSSGGGKGFKIFIIFGVVIILAIWGAVGYLFIQNKELKNENQEVNEVVEIDVETTPEPEFNPNEIKLKSGSIIREKKNGEISVLVNKEDYESTGITGFLKVVVSPDNKNICFESWSPAPDPALYISDVEGQNVIKVSSNRQNCLWSSDSKSVYYINTPTKSAPVNIFEYYIQNGVEKDLTSDFVPSGVVRRFEIVGLSADGSKIICKYENLGGAAATENISECEIDLETGNVNDL